MAHILTEPARRFYNLEALYAGAQHAEAVNFQQQSQPDVPSPRRLFPQALAPAH